MDSAQLSRHAGDGMTAAVAELRIGVGYTTVQLDIQKPLDAQRQHRLSCAGCATGFQQAGVRGKVVSIRGHERRQVGAAAFLFAFEHEGDAGRQFVVDRAQRPQREDTGSEVALVVCRAAAIELAISASGRERFALPQVDGIRPAARRSGRTS